MSDVTLLVSKESYIKLIEEQSDEITRLREENERLKAALEDVLSDIAKSEHVKNLYPSPGKSRFWKSVVNAEKLLKEFVSNEEINDE